MFMNTRVLKPVLFLISAWLVVSLACSSSSDATTRPDDQNTGPGASVKTNTPGATKTPTTAPTATKAPIGMGRENPYPADGILSLPNWDVQVLEIVRGDAAWTAIRATNMFNEPAPESMEYIMLKLYAKSNYADSDAHQISDCDFDVTGDRLILYTCFSSSVVEPEPQFDAELYTGGETEGWVAYLIGKDEGNLILVFEESWSIESDAVRYIALDEGASISVSPDLYDIAPTDLGISRSMPAPLGETVINPDWEISVLEVIRGEAAWSMVLAENQFNDPPLEGLEYIAVRIHARYIGTGEIRADIEEYSFNTTGDAGILYDNPSVVDPEPVLYATLFSGGEYEGWIVFQAGVGETGVMLVFEPFWSFDDADIRYLSLE
jgi:hypothetical protein